jgi:DNA-binding response OmpR family regulator
MHMAGETVLIIEDDATMLRGLKDNFEYEAFRVATASDGEKGLAAALSVKPDLIVLDIMLPKVNGYEICRLVRKAGLDAPIIMLTAKGQEQDIVMGLNLGADDYVTKPFSIRQLLARANAFLRRKRQSAAMVHEFGRFALDLASRRLSRGGREIPLTPKEFGLLELFLRRQGRALTREEIIRNVWGHDVFVTSRSVDRCVNTLRAKIEADPGRPSSKPCGPWAIGSRAEARPVSLLLYDRRPACRCVCPGGAIAPSASGAGGWGAGSNPACNALLLAEKICREELSSTPYRGSSFGRSGSPWAGRAFRPPKR